MLLSSVLFRKEPTMSGQTLDEQVFKDDRKLANI